MAVLFSWKQNQLIFLIRSLSRVARRRRKEERKEPAGGKPLTQ